MGQGATSPATATVVARWECDVPAIQAQHATHTATAHVEWDDGGQSLCVETSPEPHEDYGFFVRMMSWRDGNKRGCLQGHATLASLLGRRVRVTVEVIEE
jgi:hypothetical protein